jgi:hypothetical protein
MVSRLHAETPSCVWNASIFLDSSSYGMAQKACIASTLKKKRLLCSFLISSVASESVLATGLRQWFTKASVVTRYAAGGALLGWPGSSLGTMTNREKHRGSSQPFLHNGGGAYEVFQHFPSDQFSMIVCCTSRGELLRFATRDVFVSQL